MVTGNWADMARFFSVGTLFDHKLNKSNTMKRLSLIFVMILMTLFCTPAFTQVKAGIKAGLSASRLSHFEGDSRLGIHAGFLANIKLGKKWSYQQEILYSGEGQHYLDGELDWTIALGYAQIPMMIRYQPGNKAYLEFGPQLGFLVHASSNEAGSAKLNVKRSFNNTQVSLAAGAGFHINERISFYGRYHAGLTDVTLDRTDDRSSVILIGVGFIL